MIWFIRDSLQKPLFKLRVNCLSRFVWQGQPSFSLGAASGTELGGVGGDFSAKDFWLWFDPDHVGQRLIGCRPSRIFSLRR